MRTSATLICRTTNCDLASKGFAARLMGVDLEISHSHSLATNKSNVDISSARAPKNQTFKHVNPKFNRVIVVGKCH